MKNIIAIAGFIGIVITGSSQSQQELEKKVQPMADSLRKIFLEGKTGFAARRGARLSPAADGSERYATSPIACLKADDQYITVKDGKEYYTIIYSGHKAFDDFTTCTMILTDRTGKTQPGIFKWNFDSWAPKDEFSTFVINEKKEVTLCRYQVTPKTHKKTIVTIGPVVDYFALRDKENQENDIAWRARIRAQYKYTGDTEVDSIGLAVYGDVWGNNGWRDVENLYQQKADNNYDNSVGDPYTGPDGLTRYRAPAWLNANAAFYKKDTGAMGTTLYLFFSADSANTYEMLQILRRLFHRESYQAINVKDGSEFIYQNREGANMMYRFDTSAKAAYKGLTLVVMQTYHLKEKVAAAAEQARRFNNMDLYRDQNSSYKGTPVFLSACSCCHGSRTQPLKTSNTYQVTDKYGNKQGTTNYTTQVCMCCHGTGKQ